MRLKQVLLNLLSNAISTNREDGAVVVACEATDSERVRVLEGRSCPVAGGHHLTAMPSEIGCGRFRPATHTPSMIRHSMVCIPPISHCLNHSETFFAKAADLKSIDTITTQQADTEPLYAVPDLTTAGRANRRSSFPSDWLRPALPH